MWTPAVELLLWNRVKVIANDAGNVAAIATRASSRRVSVIVATRRREGRLPVAKPVHLQNYHAAYERVRGSKSPLAVMDDISQARASSRDQTAAESG